MQLYSGLSALVELQLYIATVSATGLRFSFRNKITRGERSRQHGDSANDQRLTFLCVNKRRV